ncbi:DUF2711 family protein [Bacillus sp. FJAT-22090]|uniref:DUF2711 family protein n=1 Tax=Bacillus sp. FJAT-22090 TaxID=1581038 RepID=UPI0011AB2A88|nr:DUF2711 family protein [Bacillus sp. FJAT-22090]
MRVAPLPHRYAVCAPEGMPIKTFYKDVFEEVFIFYHPFIKPKTIAYELFMPENYPSRSEISEHCEKITWKQFLELSGIQNFQHLDIGLRTLILGLNKKFANEDLANMIRVVCEKKKIIAPEEGCFPNFLMSDLLSAIKKEGHEWIWYGDEFCSERQLVFMDDLIVDHNIFPLRPKNLFTHENEILITTHWDSHFSLLCGAKNVITSIVEASNLEGFYCTEHTKMYWSL